MENITKNTQVSFRTNSDLVAKAKEIFSRNNIDMTLALNEFLSKTVQENDLPFAIYDEQKEKIFAELKAEMDNAYKSYLHGDYVSSNEVEKKWGI
jgi:addiction module RelB/DinJ family antitoxin